MPYLPKICDRCGQEELSGVSICDATAHIFDHAEGVCSCGGQLRILDGTYTHLGGPINLCHASPADVGRFRRAKERLGLL